MEINKEVVTVVLSSSAVTYIIKKLVDEIIVAWRIKRQKPFERALTKIHRIYQLLNTLKSETKADRLMIMKSENGGGVPQIGKPLYSSIMYEVFDDPLEGIKNDWQKQLLDEQYFEMLYNLDRNHGRLNISTSELHPGILKDLFTSEGVVAGKLFKLHEGQVRQVYLFINYTTDPDSSSLSSNAIRVAVSELTKLFEEEEQL